MNQFNFVRMVCLCVKELVKHELAMDSRGSIQNLSDMDISV